MARSHVVKIETNLKVGAIAQPGLRTLFLGKSRAGKSTRINAVEAAGSGKVSDVAGRAVLARDADLITLAPNGADKVFAAVRLDTGEVCEWSLARGHRAQRSGPEISFPLRDVREAILGEPDKARKWILRHGGEVKWDEVLKLVSKSLHKRLRSIAEAREGIDPSALLASAIDEAKRRAREAKSAAKAARRAGENASALGAPPTDEEIAAAEAAVLACAAATQFVAANDRLSEIQTLLIRNGVKIEGLQDDEKKIASLIAALPKVDAVPDLARGALAVAEALAGVKATTCAICGSKIDPKMLGTRAANVRRKLDDALKGAAEMERLTKIATATSAALTTTKRDRIALEAEAKNLEGIIGQSNGAATIDPTEARAALDSLRSRRAGWELAQRGEEEALQAERESSEWAQLADALSATLGSLVERARVGFQARVQAFLPIGWIFGVDLLDGEREILRIGLRDPTGPIHVLRSALSGVEWATVTAALALATAPADGPVVIAPEERAFDPVTLAEVMAAFGAVGGAAQVLLTSPVAPDYVPAGWAVIEIGESVVPIPARKGGVAPVRGPGRPSKDGSRKGTVTGTGVVQQARPEDPPGILDLFS